jgi:hypothetical protein
MAEDWKPKSNVLRFVPSWQAVGLSCLPQRRLVSDSTALALGRKPIFGFVDSPNGIRGRIASKSYSRRAGNVNGPQAFAYKEVIAGRPVTRWPRVRPRSIRPIQAHVRFGIESCLWLRTSACRRFGYEQTSQIHDHSESPALRRPSEKMARCCGRRIGSQSVRLEMRRVGSSWQRCLIARRASSVRPARAWLAATTATTIRKLGKLRNAFAAHDEASSKRPANRCAAAIPACIRYISGSSGLRRIA